MSISTRVPDEATVASARVTAFARAVAEHHAATPRTYTEQWAWSVEHLDESWAPTAGRADAGEATGVRE